MMKWIANILINRRLMGWVVHTSIGLRLLLVSIIVAIIPGLVISVLGGIYIQALDVHEQAVQVSSDAVKVANDQLSYLEQMNADRVVLQSNNVVANTVGSQDADTGQLEQKLSNEINTLRATCRQTLTRYQQNYLLRASSNMESVRGQLANDQAFGSIAGDQQSTYGVVNQEWQAYIQAQSQELAALQSNQPNTYQLNLTASDKYAPLEKDWIHIISLSETIRDQVNQVNVMRKVYFDIAGMVAFLVILAVVVMIGYTVYLTIARPLRELVKMARRISTGDTSARVAIRGNDEIYQVAGSMNKMMDNIVQLIEEVESQRNALQERIEALATEVRGIGQGDLQTCPEVGSGMLGAVAMFFNDMIEELGSLVIRVKMGAREVEASTTVTLAMLAQLVQTSNVQLQGITEAMVEVEQMANSSRQVAERTHMLSEVVHDAQSTIEKGRLSVKQAVDGIKHIRENVSETFLKMENLSQQSKTISSIITVTANTAQQMKILANDAARHASMVGEGGDGFGVVARDLQRLAERTSGQISSMIQVVQGIHEDILSAALSIQSTEQECLQGTKLAWDAGGSLETIFAAVEHQAREMDVINQMTMQQLQSFNAIENIMLLISQSTQQINANTNRASQILEYLARQVEELRNSVETFKLRESSSVLDTTIVGDAVPPLPYGVSQRLAYFHSLTSFSGADLA